MDLKTAIDTVLMAIGTALVGYALLLFRRAEPQVVGWLETQITAKNLAQIKEYARLAVIYAEKAGIDQEVETKIKVLGEEKKAWAVTFLQNLADSYSIPVDVEEVEAHVEAAFSDQFGGWLKEFELPTDTVARPTVPPTA